MSIALKKVTRANVELAASTEFRLLSGILSALQHKVDNDIPTAMTDGIHVSWNEEFVCNMTPKEIAFVVCHEAAHSFLMHNETSIRLKLQNAQFAAHAVDHMVNNFILDCDPTSRVTQLPVGGIMDRKYQGMDIYQVFKDLMVNGSNAGDGFDIHDFAPGKLNDKETELLGLAIEAGKRSMGATRTANADVQERGNFRQQLAQWLYARGRGQGQVTWKSPNRRMIHKGIYLPSPISKTLRRAVFACDTSGSIQGEELSEAITIFKTIVQQVGCDELHILYWDDGVVSHETYRFATGEKLSATTPKGGGGTNFAPVLDYIAAKGLAPDLMVVTTDGYIGDWGSCPKFPTLWAISTNETPPWGELLRV